MTNIQAVIFDLDDTLYPEPCYTFSGYHTVAEAFSTVLGDPTIAYQRMRDLFDSPHRSRVFNVLLEETGHADADAIVKQMIAVFREHIPRIALYDDAEEALSILRPNYKLGVISDGFLNAQRNKVKALQIESRVDQVILTDIWGRESWKPNPRAFEEIARNLNVVHTACVYIGDNLAKDFVAPNELGWKSIYIDRPEAVHRTNPAPPGGEPKRNIKSLVELASILPDLL